MLTFTRWWIVFGAALASAGWLLSAFSRLDQVGYSVVLVLVAASSLIWLRSQIDPLETFRRSLRKGKQRFRRPLPLIFILLVLLNFVGGMLHPVALGDTLCYKVPRLEHWFDARHWHWIHTADPRLNAVGC